MQGQQRDKYSFNPVSEALTVNANGTYKWNPITGKVIFGVWRATEDGSGIVLMKGFLNINWTFRKETNFTEENLNSFQIGLLTADGKTSIKTQRPIKKLFITPVAI
jgi:hypothetical protein